MIRCSAFLCIAFLSAQGLAPDLGRVNDAKSWRVIDADASVEGPVVHLKPHGDPAVGSNIGLALLQNVKFSEGTLEIDLRGAGQQQASFLGLAFGVVDARTFEAVYFRPFRFADEDPVARGHAVQYVAWPDTHGRSCARPSLASTKPPSSPFRIPPGGFTSASK